jgi:hypothetical protein
MLSSLFGGNADPVIPKGPILSARVTLSFTDGLGNIYDIAEFDSMSKKKVFEPKKRFRPFGSMKTITLKKDAGWEFTLSGMKTDHLLNRFVYFNEMFLQGGDGISSLPINDNTDAFGAPNSIPMFIINEKTHIVGDFYESYDYYDVTLEEFSEETPDDDKPITYSVSFFSPYRRLNKLASDPAGDKNQSNISDILLDVLSKNK